ncbi:hypothetical protein NUH88_08945 [Nisaea acidiphila]|uniref:Lipoprotein n=1 Tax=Nisaea acidiphila TaxID=1862145 RepID=A0A9J7AXL7_9PROT|nr:hypothetical protein [Nisaea acidiphila]UUX51814.1 hypothetical protein NUH88_08945 [Nisaea acidiphila]
MSAKSLVAAMAVSLWLPACADPEAAARLEIRRQNALATIEALRETYCALSPATRRRLRAAGEIDPEFDTCVPATATEKAE